MSPCNGRELKVRQTGIKNREGAREAIIFSGEVRASILEKKAKEDREKGKESLKERKKGHREGMPFGYKNEDRGH